MSFTFLNKSYIVSRLSCSGYFIILETVNSTNQYLIDNLPYLKLGSVCLAKAQTDGRGRYGKHWISPCNNFYLSFYWFFLNYPKRSVSVLSLIVSVVICEVLQGLGVKQITLKWPNDIYIAKRKLAGILIEIITKFHDYLHIVIGIGINLNMISECSKCDVEMISLEEVGIFVDYNILVIDIINMLYKSLIEFECFGFLPFFSRWLALDSYYNQSVKLLIGSRIIFGISRGVNLDGLLLLEHSGSIYSYSCVKNMSLR